jgi:hypothetical protein
MRAAIRTLWRSRNTKDSNTTRTTPALAEHTRKWQLEKPALYMLALTVALLAGCGSAGPGTFSSQNYGYSVAHSAGWSGKQASYHWPGAGSPGFDDSDVDLFSGPNGITVIAYGAASRASLVAYTRATAQAATAEHQCPAVPASDQAITIGGAPARLLSTSCQGLSIETAITVHAGKAIVFTSNLASGTKSDRAAFRRFLAGIRFQR